MGRLSNSSSVIERNVSNVIGLTPLELPSVSRDYLQRAAFWIGERNLFLPHAFVVLLVVYPSDETGVCVCVCVCVCVWLGLALD